MTRGMLCALVLSTACLVSGQPARAGQAPPARVVVEAHGLELSLTVPGRAFPRNALVLGVARLRNISEHAIVLGGSCPYGVLWIQVRSRNNAVLYPPAVPMLFPDTCGGPSPGPTLPAGQAREERLYVIVRGPDLRGIAVIDSQGTTLVTSPLRVRLLPGRAPRTVLHTSPRLYADIRPPTGARGRLKYISASRCATSSVEDILGWHTAKDRTLSPGCVNPLEWHAVAGWLNQPVAFINYVAPASKAGTQGRRAARQGRGDSKRMRIPEDLQGRLRG